MISKNKVNCPVCDSSLTPNNEKNDEILVCPFCEKSLFMYKDKGNTKLIPFNLNVTFKGNKVISPEDLTEGTPEFDFDEEEDFD